MGLGRSKMKRASDSAKSAADTARDFLKTDAKDAVRKAGAAADAAGAAADAAGAAADAARSAAAAIGGAAIHAGVAAVKLGGAADKAGEAATAVAKNANKVADGLSATAAAVQFFVRDLHWALYLLCAVFIAPYVMRSLPAAKKLTATAFSSTASLAWEYPGLVIGALGGFLVVILVLEVRRLKGRLADHEALLHNFATRIDSASSSLDTLDSTSKELDTRSKELATRARRLEGRAADLETSTRQPVTLAAGVVAHSTHPGVVRRGKVVELYGQIKSDGITNHSLVGTIPDGYRPPSVRVLGTVYAGVHINVGPAGDIRVLGIGIRNGGWIGLIGSWLLD